MEDNDAAIDTIHVATVINHLGKTAAFVKDEYQLVEYSVNFLLRTHTLLDERGIANTLYGLGRLAERRLLKAISYETIIQMMEKLAALNPTEQNIESTLHGLGKLAEQELLRAIPQDAILMLAEKLAALNPTEQNIANTLHSLGKLAEQELLRAIPHQTILTLVEKLATLAPNEQGIANSLYGLGKLAERGLLNAIPHQTILTLVGKLATLAPNEQDIANTVYSLGKLVEQRLLKAISYETIIQMVGKLVTLAPNGQDIANSLYGLGKLAEQGLLNAIPHQTILTLVGKLVTLAPNEQNIANTVYSLARLIQADLKPVIPLTAVIGLLNSARREYGKTNMAYCTRNTVNLIETTAQLLAVIPSPAKESLQEAVQAMLRLYNRYLRHQRLNLFQQVRLVISLGTYSCLVPTAVDEIDTCLQRSLAGLARMSLPSAAAEQLAACAERLAQAGLSQQAQRIKALFLPAAPALEPIAVPPTVPQTDEHPPLQLALRKAPQVTGYQLDKPQHIKALEQRLRQERPQLKYCPTEGEDKLPLLIAPLDVLEGGLGVFSKQDIPAGIRLGCYQGERRPEDGKESFYAFVTDDGDIVDTLDKRNWTAFVNHSPQPNVSLKQERNAKGRAEIVFITATEIKAKQQLLINYGPRFFCSDELKPLFLQPSDNWLGPDEYYQQYKRYFAKQPLLLSGSLAQDLFGQATVKVLSTHLFKAVYDNDTKAVAAYAAEAMLKGLAGGYVLTSQPQAGTDSFAPSKEQPELTALMLACYLGRDKAMLETLLPHSDINRCCRQQGQHALFYLIAGLAKEDDKITLLSWLAEKGSHLTGTNHQGLSPLALCFKRGQLELAKALLAILKTQQQDKESMHEVLEDTDIDVFNRCLLHPSPSREYFKHFSQYFTATELRGFCASGRWDLGLLLQQAAQQGGSALLPTVRWLQAELQIIRRFDSFSALLTALDKGLQTTYLAEGIQSCLQQQRVQLLNQAKKFHAAHPRVLKKLTALEQAPQVSPVTASGYGLFAVKNSARNAPAEESTAALSSRNALT